MPVRDPFEGRFRHTAEQVEILFRTEPEEAEQNRRRRMQAELLSRFPLTGQTLTVVARKPDGVRMQCWGPLGTTVLDLAVKGGRATLHLPRERRAVRIDLARLAIDRMLANISSAPPTPAPTTV